MAQFRSPKDTQAGRNCSVPFEMAGRAPAGSIAKRDNPGSMSAGRTVAEFSRTVRESSLKRFRRVVPGAAEHRVRADAAGEIRPTPDLLGLKGTPDLMQHQGSLVMEVRVVLERAQRIGVRRHPWSRRLSSTATLIDPVTGEAVPAQSWSVVGRDTAREERLAGRVRRLIE